MTKAKKANNVTKAKKTAKATKIKKSTKHVIAIIGGGGFIGTVLAGQLLAAGHEIRILDIVPSSAYPDKSRHVDVCDALALRDALVGVDVIYNLAAQHRDDVFPVQKYYDVNVGGAENTIAAATYHDIKTIIFTSSVAIYGLNADADNGATEETTPDPFNDYGSSKLEAEAVFSGWAAEDSSRSLSVLRLVATFGAGNRGNIYNLMDQVARGRFIMVGSGKNKKSIAYVENVAAFLVRLLGMDAGTHIYNYADKPDLTTHELMQIISGSFGHKNIEAKMRIPYWIGILGGIAFDIAANVTGRRFPVSRVRVQKFCASTVVNADAVKTTGFVPVHTLAGGLSAMIAADFSAFVRDGQKEKTSCTAKGDRMCGCTHGAKNNADIAA